MGSSCGKPWRVALATGYPTKETKRGDQVHILPAGFQNTISSRDVTEKNPPLMESLS